MPPGGLPEETPTLVIANVTVIPMTGEGAVPFQTVVIAGERIVAAGPSASTPMPAGVRIVDGTGKFLIPGLIDMHIHLPPDAGEPGGSARRLLAMMVANGVTTARSLAGHPAQLELRGRVASGEVVGPRLILAAPAIHQQNTTNPEAARERVREAKAAGWDLIKSHAIADPAIWSAVQEEARRVGLPVSGHVTNEVGLDRAIAAGQQIEHLDGFIAELVSDESLRRGWGQIPPAAVLDQIDSSRVAPLARRMADARVWSTPTLALFERIADTSTAVEALRAGPGMAYVSSAALEQWSSQRAQLIASGYLEGVSERLPLLRRTIVRELARAGAPLLAGSDTPQAFLLPGFGLHQELDALVAAGLTPGEALATATRNPAEYLASLPREGSGEGEPARIGVIAVGSEADLVLLDENPLDRIGATRSIRGVVMNGRWFDRGALDHLLESARPPETVSGEVILVRHAETAGGGADPALSAAGIARAERLAGNLPKLDRVWTTPYARTRSTAEPAAKRFGLQPEVYDPRDLAGFAEKLRSAGGVSLVVGHSNTTPELVRLLGGEPGSPIAENEYDRIYRLSLPSGRTVVTRYGGEGDE